MNNLELFNTKTESAGHKIGKKVSRVYLMKNNFLEKEIKEEYPVIFPSGRIRIIDMVGISKTVGKKVGLEVGDLNGGSLDELYLFFDEVRNIKKINIEEEFINDIINFYERENNTIKNLLYNKYNSNPRTKKDLRIYKILENPLLNSFLELFTVDLDKLDEDKLQDFVEEEIDFVYNKINLSSENYDKIYKRLYNYYKNRLEKELNKANESIEIEGYEEESTEDAFPIGRIVDTYDIDNSVGI